MKAKIETTFGPCSDTREISIAYEGRSFLTIYGRHINGWFLCIPDWNISCKLGNPADGAGTGYNVCSLAEAFKKIGWNHNDSTNIARAILTAIYDYENYGKEKCS